MGILDIDKAMLESRDPSALYTLYSSSVLGVSLVPFPDGRDPNLPASPVAINIPVGDILKGLEGAVGDLSQFLGNVIGDLLGGIAESILEAIKDDIHDILQDLKLTAEEVIKFAADKLRDVLEQTINQLDDMLQKILNRVMYLTVLIRDMLSQQWDQINRDVLIWIFEANIAGYDAAAELPFTPNEPRIVYANPIWIRGGENFDITKRITLRGNFLKKFKKFKINNEDVTPIHSTGNELSFELPDDVAKTIRQYRSGSSSIIVSAKKSGLFRETIKDTLAIPILPQLEYYVEAAVTPLYNQVQRGTFPVENDTGKTDDDSRTVVWRHDVRRVHSDAVISGFKKVFIRKNRDTQFKSAQVTGGGRIFEVRCYLEGEGIPPFEGAAWFHYKYIISYKHTKRNITGNTESFVLDDESDLDETASVITKYFQYPDGKKLAMNTDIERLRWAYKCTLRVVAYADNEVGEHELKVVHMDSNQPIADVSRSTINGFGELVVTIDSDRIQTDADLD